MKPSRMDTKDNQYSAMANEKKRTRLTSLANLPGLVRILYRGQFCYNVLFEIGPSTQSKQFHQSRVD